MSVPVNQFKSTLKAHGGLYRPSNFRVIIPGITDIDILARSTTIPGRNLGETLMFGPGGVQVPLPGNPTFDTWTCTILNLNDLQIHTQLSDWADQAYDWDAGTYAQPEDVERDIIIQPLDNNLQVIKSLILVDAFPTLVGEITTAVETVDTESTFDLTIRFLRIKPE